MKIPGFCTAAILSAALAALGPPAAAAASNETSATPLPRLQGPIDAPAAMFPGLQKVPAGTDLADYGYTVDEYLVSGRAAGQPYTTRILVRQPADPARFSGIVVSEVMHSSGNSWMFFFTRLHVMRQGHAHVGIAAQKGPVESLIVPSNPARYARLALPDAAQANEIIAQVGALLKRNPAGGPLPAGVRKLILMGTSQSAGSLRAYLAAHPVYRLPGGGPIYDGFLPTSTGGNSPMPRVDVPLIQIPTQTEVLAGADSGNPYRREDGDAAGEQFRLYEIAGMPHNDSRENPTYEGDFCDMPMSVFPVGAMMSMALSHLVAWVDQGVAPPRAARIEVDGDSAGDGSPLVLDDYGNARGGIRSTYVDVPSASHGVPNRSDPVPGTRNDFFCRIAGYQIPLPDATLRDLYSGSRDYRRKVDARLRELIDAGWFLPEYADQVTGNAMTLRLP